MPGVEWFASSLNGLISDWGLGAYLGLALLVAVEGPLVTVGGAMAAAAGAMDPLGVFLAASAGNLTADLLWYTVGYVSKTDWLVRYSRWLRLNLAQIQRLEQAVHDHAPRLLFLSKLTLSLMVPALVATGMARVPWRRWFGYLAAGEAVWTGVLVILGYYFGAALQHLDLWLQVTAGAGLLVTLLIIIRFITRRVEPEKPLQ